MQGTMRLPPMQLSKNYIVQDTTASGWDGIVRKFTDIYMSIFLVEKNYTKEEIDVFVEACKNGGDFLDAFFK